MKTFQLILIILCFSIGSLSAGDQATAFLQIPTDAVSLSLGGYQPASVNGAADVFSNPALLVFHKKGNLQLSNILGWDLMQYLSLAYTRPVSEHGTAGIGLVGVNIPKIMEYDRDGRYLGDFNNYQVALTLSYAHHFFPFSVGFGLNVVRMAFTGNQFENSANGVGLTLGMTYTPHSALRMGVRFRNGFELNWKNNYSDYSPKQFDLGFSFLPPGIMEGKGRLMVALNQTEKEPMRLAMGLEITPLGTPNFALRGGLGNFNLEKRDKLVDLAVFNQAERFYSLGAGIAIGKPDSRGVELDYTFKLAEILDNQHCVTTKIWF